MRANAPDRADFYLIGKKSWLAKSRDCRSPWSTTLGTLFRALWYQNSTAVLLNDSILVKNNLLSKSSVSTTLVARGSRISFAFFPLVFYLIRAGIRRQVQNAGCRLEFCRLWILQVVNFAGCNFAGWEVARNFAG
jgi:hypothetical protein